MDDRFYDNEKIQPGTSYAVIMERVQGLWTQRILKGLIPLQVDLSEFFPELLLDGKGKMSTPIYSIDDAKDVINALEHENEQHHRRMGDITYFELGVLKPLE